MAFFSMKKIDQTAANHATYLRGVSAYKSGKVHDVTRGPGEFYDELLAGQVEEEGGACQAEVGITAEGEADYLHCTCPGFRSAGGACKHIVALLVHKYYSDMVAGLSSSAPADNGKGAPTDRAARQMIGLYIGRAAAELAARTAHDNEQVRLTPMMEVTGHRVQLTFTIGGKRPYILRDIAQFCADMRAEEMAEYGKNLRFVHRMESFEEESRPLVAFLMSCWGEIMVRQPWGAAPTRVGRELVLGPAALDRFFRLYEGKTVPCREGGETRNLLFRDGSPAMTVRVEPDEIKRGFELTCGPIHAFSGDNRLYIAAGGVFYRCDEEFSASMGEFCRAMETGRGSLFVSHQDIAEFCSAVLPAIRRVAEVQGRLDLLAAYLPQELETQVYLDAPEFNVVTARLVCRYGEAELNPYVPSPREGPVRDRLGELKARLVVEKYFPNYAAGEGYLVMRGDDEDIFRLVTDGVEEISAVAAVFATDRFRRIGMEPPPPVSVGVRLDSSLLEIEFDVTGFDREELARVLASYRLHRRYHRLRSGRFLRLEDSGLDALTQMADDLDLTEKEWQSGHIRAPRYRALYLDRMLRENDGVAYHRDTPFRELVKNLQSAGENDFPPPASLDRVLRNYQKTGHRWLRTMETYGFGGILADDMGLGKTLQVISLLLDARERGNDLPSLVVCPASLVLNWEAEVRRFAPALTVLPVLGDAEQRAVAWRRVGGYDLAITSYDLLKRDIPLLRGKTFRYHILDEAQYIKNHHTQNARAAKAVDSRQRFALTGTPIENRLSELWSIFDFLMPGFLYGYGRFKESFETPIIKGGNREALDRLSRMTSPFILRRLKQDVLRELPEKTESVLYATLEGEQRRLYAANAAQALQRVREEDEDDFRTGKLEVLSILTRLRQLCCDPALCYEDYGGGSAKLEMCVELLKEAVGAGHKVLLFSQFTSMLAILEKRLAAEGITYYLLQGSTPKEKRAALVDSFNRDGTHVFLISLKAGGTGLNLTGADMVIHFDPWWNVSAQNQATDRAHRIGQQHSVQVYKLIAKDTVEEKILLMQESKRDLAECIIREGDGILNVLTRQQLLELLE